MTTLTAHLTTTLSGRLIGSVHDRLGGGLTAHVSSRASSHVTLMLSNVCPKAPPGMGNWDSQILGWVKWGTLTLIVISGFVSIGTIVLSRVFAHPHGSRMGAMGLAITVLCAVLFVAIYAIVTGITGSGC